MGVEVRVILGPRHGASLTTKRLLNLNRPTCPQDINAFHRRHCRVFRTVAHSRILSLTCSPPVVNLSALGFRRSRRRYPTTAFVMAESYQQTRHHSGHHHHHGDNVYLTSTNKHDAGVRITRIGLYVNLVLAVGKGIGGYVFHSQGKPLTSRYCARHGHSMLTDFAQRWPPMPSTHSPTSSPTS